MKKNTLATLAFASSLWTFPSAFAASVQTTTQRGRVRRLFYSIALTTVLACAAWPVGAATYYVSTSGNDTTGDGSAGNPWATIGNADSKGVLAPGDTVIVREGTYPQSSTEGVVLQGSAGTAESPITYKAEGRILIDQSGFAAPSYGFEVRAGGIVLDGFEIKGAVHGVRINAVNDILVTNCTIHDSAPVDSSGIWVVSANNVKVMRNVIYNINASANNAWGTVGVGVRTAGSVLDVLNNTIDNCFLGIFYYPPFGTITTRNNIVINSKGWGFVNPWSTDPSTFTSEYNLIWQNTVHYGNFPAGNNGPYPTDVADQDPKFVYPAGHDYHLVAASPAMDAGVDVGLPFQGAAPDMGAFEGAFPPRQVAIVTGVVSANVAGNPPVRGALVQAQDGGASTTTEGNGNYSLEVTAGSVTLKASARGLADKTSSVTVSAGGSVRLNISLDLAGTPKTYYVDNATGNDSNPGTEALSWKTIGNGDAKDLLNPGDTVIVKAATYPQADANGVNLTKSLGYPFAPITYKADGVVLIDQSSFPGTSYGFNVAARGIVLDGFEVKAAQHGIYLAPGSHDCTVNACVVHDAKAAGQNAEGIFVDKSDNVTITRNVLYNINEASATPWSPIGCGIRTSGADNLKVWNNTIDNAYVGVFYDGGGGFGAGPYGRITTQNNIVVNCTGWAFVNPWSTDPSKFVSSFNLVFGNKVDYGNFPANNNGPLPTDISGQDPLFVNAAAHDYHPQNSSPALNAGSELGLPFIGPAPDLGAIESSYIPPVQTYYVDAATGDDNNPGTSAQPWKTIDNGDAKGLLSFGDTIIVKAGAYPPASADGVRLAKRSGTRTAPITYKADGKVVIDQTGTSGTSYGFNISVRSIVLDGFEVLGAQHGIYLAPGSHGCTVNACVVHDANAAGQNAEGLFVDRSDNGTLTRNVIYNINDAGSTPWSPIGCGIRTSGSENLKVWNNVIDNAYVGVFYYGGGGFGAGPYGHITTQNNIVVNCTGWGFANPWSTVPATFTSGNNLVIGNAINYGNFPAGSNGPLPSDVADQDPQFVNPAAGDYHLQATSPALDKGTDVGLPFAGAAPDIGAYELPDTTPPTLLSARRDLFQETVVVVVFSEPVSEATATKASNYGIDRGVTVNAAALLSRSTVVLTTSPFSAGPVYLLTLNGVEDRAGIRIAANSQIAIAVPPAPRQQDGGTDGLLVLEAEHFGRNTPVGGTSWELTAEFAGYSGDGAMVATPDSNRNVNIDVSASPRLEFAVSFVKTGTHYVWVRGLGDGAPGPSGRDSVNVGLDGQLPATSDRITGFPFDAGFVWSNSTADNAPAAFEVTAPGEHVVTIWMREDGFVVDKLLLTTNPAYVPTDLGPPESPGAITKPLRLGIARQGAALSISWEGAATLQSADEVTGQWSDVQGATSPYPVNPSEDRRFYRLKR